MDFWEVLKNRRSIREFDLSKKVTDEQVKKLIEAAKMAPSAGNAQDWEFIIVKDKEATENFVKATSFRQSFIAQASCVIVVCVDFNKTNPSYGERGTQLYSIQDTAAATQNILLAATASGLGACWVGAFDEDEVKKILNLKSNLRPVVIIPIGYPK